MAVSRELVVFVREALAHGRSRGEVADVLERAGWQPEQVKAALAAFAAVDFPIPVPRPEPSVSAREAFAYLLLFTTLYVVAYSLGRLIFQFINLGLPDPAASIPETYLLDSMRWSVASLVVAFPVFLYMSRLTNRWLAEDPGARASPVRRWLTYLTLFIAACVLIGDFVTVVDSLLGGELTIRFLLKFLTVATIAGTVFWYYLADLRRDELDARA